MKAGLSIRAITFTCRCSSGSFWLAWKAFFQQIAQHAVKSASDGQLAGQFQPPVHRHAEAVGPWS